MKYLLLFFLIVLSFSFLNGLFLNMEGKEPYCFYQEIQTEQSLLISYVVSGNGEDKLTFAVFKEAKYTNEQSTKKWAIEPYFIVTGKRDLEYKIDVEENQQFKICFKSEDGDNKVLSFDFMIENKIQDVNENKDLRAITLQSLKKNYRKLEKIFRNQHYQQIRDQVHTEKINSTSRKVKWCSLFKILVLIIVCGLQIYILTAFLKNKHKLGVPETMME